MKKTPPRIIRLKSAKEWVKTYSGKHIVRGYAKKFRVDKLCAVKELRMIGIEISEQYENQLRRCAEELKRIREQRAENIEQELDLMFGVDMDEKFAFIAGYTSCGFPYGISHEEMDEINNIDLNL